MDKAGKIDRVSQRHAARDVTMRVESIERVTW